MAQALRGEVPTRTETFTATTGKAAGKASGRGLGAIVIERPIADVWAVVARYDDKAEYQPRVESVEVLERKPGLLRVRMTVDASVTTVRYTGWFALDEQEHVIHWTLDRTAKDNSIADMDGEYRLFELA